MIYVYIYVNNGIILELDLFLKIIVNLIIKRWYMKYLIILFSLDLFKISLFYNMIDFFEW